MSLWVLLIADTHIGSAFALWPKDFRTSNGVLVNFTDGQEYLLHNWNWAVGKATKMAGGSFHVLGFVGDLVHGQQTKDDGINLIEPDPHFQGRAFIHLCRGLADISEEIHMVQGTKYHVRANSEAEEMIGLEFGAVKDPRGHHCTEWIPYLGISGVGLDIAHSQSVAMINRGMPLERERRFANQIANMKYGDIHLIIRAHLHTYIYLDIDGERELGLPSTALQDPYCKKSRTPNRLISKWLGFVLLEIIPENLGTGMSPVIPHPIMFPHPPLPCRLYGGQNGDERADIQHGGYLAGVSQRVRNIFNRGSTG